MNSFSESFFGHLLAIGEWDPSLFKQETNIIADYGLARSAHRGATTCAMNAGISQSDIEWVNQWNSGGCEVVSAPMHVIYLEQKQMLNTFLGTVLGCILKGRSATLHRRSRTSLNGFEWGMD